MRIWSKRLITSGVLPTKQLKAMRYELGDMIKQYPNIKHSLVKFANNYDCAYLGQYFILVCRELDKRGINKNISYDTNIISIVLEKSKFNDDIYFKECTFDEDNCEYFDICYYNLYEKYLRGIITKEEWQKIEDLIGGEIK